MPVNSAFEKFVYNSLMFQQIAVSFDQFNCDMKGVHFPYISYKIIRFSSNFNLCDVWIGILCNKVINMDM